VDEARLANRLVKLGEARDRAFPSINLRRYQRLEQWRRIAEGSKEESRAGTDEGVDGWYGGGADRN